MKKLFTLLFLIAAFVSFKGTAQTVACPNLVVNFTYQATNPTNVIQFTNTTQGYETGDTIQWTFGDGSTSSDMSPLHTYTTGGTKQVCLIIRKVAQPGTVPCANYHCTTINVIMPCTLSAAFTSQGSTSNSLGVYFTNTSTDFATGDSIRWSFGDGTYAYTSNAYHAYANAGTYNVCLWVKKNNTVSATTPPCVSEICHTVTVTIPCNLVVSFTSQSLAGTQPNSIRFTNTSTGYAAGDSVLWTFGDGTSSNTPNPIHTYTTGNTYHVCITIIKPAATGTTPCTGSICHDIAVTVPVTCNLHASFSSQSGTAGTSAQVVYFTNTSTGFATGDSIRWSFGDGTYSYAVNPVHTYLNAGIYNVCLWVKKNNLSTTTPCVSEICHTVTVSVPCNLVVNYTSAAAGQPNVIQFTSTTTGYAVGDTIQWTFGDGSSSSVLNPLHTYAAAGTYQVCLIIRKVVAPGTAACANYHCGSITVSLPCTLSASFTSQPSTSNTLGVYFTNTSTGFATGDSIRWSFGDGTYAYTATAYHAYANAGTYNVCLWVKKNSTSPTVAPCVSEICHTVTVTAPCTLSASFTSQPSTSNPLGVYFTNTSTGFATGDSIRWSFGDGTYAYTATAYHAYANAGTYNVCLWVKKNSTSPNTTPCVSEICHTVTVTAPCNISASFTSTPAATQPNMIQFTNTSAGYAAGDSVLWTFGDGSSSNQSNPLHTYTTGNTYHICLTIIHQTASGTAPCSGTVCHDIAVTVPPVCTLSAAFTSQPSTSNPLGVYFTNTSTGFATGDSIRWSFGDGTYAYTATAYHAYANAGTYNVCIRVKKNNWMGSTPCVSEICHTVTVTQPQVSCNDLANFHYTSVSVTGLSAAFTPDHIYTDVTYTWTFGDGTGSHDITATHTFATTGYYTVCLTAYRNNSCAATSCQIVHLPAGSTPNCNNNTLGFVTTTNTSSLNSVTFTGSSNAPILSQVWTITRIPATATSGTVTLHATNPTYAFSDTGTYYVCLHATFAGGCTKDYCRQIHVNFPVGGTNACSLQLYPNPATSTVNVMVTLTQAAVINAVVYNSSNMQVLQKEQQGVVGINTMNLNIATLAAGVYTMRVTYGTQVCYATFIKQ